MAPESRHLHPLPPKELRALQYGDRELLDFLEHPRFREIRSYRNVRTSRLVWAVTYVDSDKDLVSTDGDPSWRLALQSAIKAVGEIEPAS